LGAPTSDLLREANSLLFGRKSEKLDHHIEQLELQLEDPQADEAEAAREMPGGTKRRVKIRCASRCRKPAAR
jgi:hypothetical protein